MRYFTRHSTLKPKHMKSSMWMTLLSETGVGRINELIMLVFAL